MTVLVLVVAALLVGVVLAARREPGVDPEVADRVLQRLDVRSMASLR